ncbi:MAG: hypothetical protein KDM63_19575, partial [Verrucomicrobiae bacterium]|nr:hypothetical protein [Verrucomicrobiae bacterium]
WLADFGLARRSQDDGDDCDPTATAGTPGYLAPELAAGGEPDARADLFALGGLMRDLATDTSPTWFLDLCDRLRSENPEDRPDSAEAVFRELETHHESMRLAAWGWRAFAKWLKAGAASVAIIALIGGAVALVDLFGHSRIVNATLSRLTGRTIDLQGRFGVYETLAAAVASARDGDTVVLRGRNPYFTASIHSEGKSLAIVGADSEFPAQIWLDPKASINEPAFWWSGEGRLVLRDLELHHEPRASVSMFTRPVPALIRLNQSALEMERVRLRRVPVSESLSPIAILAVDSPSIVMKDSKFHNTFASLVTWSGTPTLPAASIHVERCWISGSRIVAFNVAANRPRETRLSVAMIDCLANVDTAFAFLRDSQQLEIDISLEDCQLQTRKAFFANRDGKADPMSDSVRLQTTGGRFAHLGPGLSGFPGDAGTNPPARLREPIFRERTWILLDAQP